MFVLQNIWSRTSFMFLIMICAIFFLCNFRDSQNGSLICNFLSFSLKKRRQVLKKIEFSTFYIKDFLQKRQNRDKPLKKDQNLPDTSTKSETRLELSSCQGGTFQKELEEYERKNLQDCFRMFFLHSNLVDSSFANFQDFFFHKHQSFLSQCNIEFSNETKNSNR